MTCADDLFVGGNGCCTCRQERKQFDLVVVNAEKVLPVPRNCVGWFYASAGTFPSPCSCFGFQAINVFAKPGRSVLTIAAPIKQDDLYDRSGGNVLCRNEIFQAVDQIILCSCPQFPHL